jgi:hypothetical protein
MLNLENTEATKVSNNFTTSNMMNNSPIHPTNIFGTKSIVNVSTVAKPTNVNTNKMKYDSKD